MISDENVLRDKYVIFCPSFTITISSEKLLQEFPSLQISNAISSNLYNKGRKTKKQTCVSVLPKLWASAIITQVSQFLSHRVEFRPGSWSVTLV